MTEPQQKPQLEADRDSSNRLLRWTGALRPPGIGLFTFGAVSLSLHFAGRWIFGWLSSLSAITKVTLCFVAAGALFFSVSNLVRLTIRLRASLRAGLVSSAIWTLAGAAAGAFWVLLLAISSLPQHLWISLITAAFECGLAGRGALAMSRRVQTPAAGYAMAKAQSQTEAPIQQEDQDWFDRDDFSAALAIDALNGPNTVLALTGALGSGKSSTLNLIANRLEKAPSKPIIVRFSPWLPSGCDALITDLLQSIERAIRQRYFMPNASRKLRQFARALSASAHAAQIKLAGLFGDGGQKEILDDLRTLIGRLPVRIIVLLDEIDRMGKEELAELFKVLRGVPDLENICFVCALDPDTVARTISKRASGEEFDFAREYVEKFIPNKFQLPFPSEKKMLDIAHDRLQEIFEQAKIPQGCPSAAEAVVSNRQFYRMVFSTPRRLKIILNAVAHLVSSSREPIYPEDALNLAALWDLNPGLVSDICRFPDLYTEMESASLTDLSVPMWIWTDKKSRDSRRSQYFNQRLTPLRNGLRQIELDLLSNIFPQVAKWRSSNQRDPSHQNTLDLHADFQIGNAISKSDAIRMCRMCHPRYVLRYLTGVVPDSQFGQMDFDALMGRLKATPGPEAARDIIREVASLAEPGSLKSLDFLSQLQERLAEIPSNVLPGVARALSDVAPQMLGRDSPGSDERVATDLVLAVANVLQPTGQAHSVLQNAIESSPDDNFAADILFFCVHRDRNEIMKDWSGIDVDILRNAFGSRVSKRYRRGSAESLFAEDGKLSLGVMYRWAECGPFFSNSLSDYLKWEFEKNPKNTGRFVLSVIGIPMTRRADSADRIRGLYPNVWELLSRLQHAQPGSLYSNAAEGEAIDWLIAELSKPSAAGFGQRADSVALGGSEDAVTNSEDT